ncbi:MAG TPA: hypothetical protein PKZ27_02875 [Rhodocyclaceae bacterium]|nr:hypothetical protein [Burkholderiaceae bacterium]HRP74509.1 hypothetical protein [Rhodocyclaceae bacterium]
MTTITEWFGDVRAELEPNPDRPGMSCFLYHRSDDGSEFMGSLQLCENFGGIPHDQGGPTTGPQVYFLSPALLQEIENWAVENGY